MNAASTATDDAAQELNDLRLVFANIAGYNKVVGLKNILKVPEVKAQVSEGDLLVGDLESAWLEACAVKGVSAVDPKDVDVDVDVDVDLDVDGANMHVHQRASWGVCTELSFEGFVHFLRLCEAQAPLPSDVATAAEASPKDAKTGRDLLAARHHMAGLLRATLTVHQRGGGGEEEEKDHIKDSNSQLGDSLHLSMVRAAMEEGLSRHTQETLHELKRTGVYKESGLEVQLAHQERRASLRLGLLSRKFSHDELVAAGILQEKTPEQFAAGRASAARSVRRHLQQRSAGSVADLLAAAGKEHHRSPSDLEHLKAKGIYRTPEQIEEDEEHHRLAGALLQRELGHRPDISGLKAKGIYLSREADVKHRLERSMVADQLSKSFRDRPYLEDLMDRGLLEASHLVAAFEGIVKEKGGPVTAVEDLLKWPIIASAVEEKVVGVPALEEAFVAAMTTREDGGNNEHMSYEQFDKFLSSTKTTQVEEHVYSLKLWALMRMRPNLDEQEHHDGNRRRNALMAQELEHELGKREPLERLANKGIYLEKSPRATAVERAHLSSTLKHGLAHRPDLAELATKGVYLEGVLPNDLEKAHRDARNYLEGTLSRRPSISKLLEMGYLEADELEEAFTELVVEYKHDAVAASATTADPAAAAPAGANVIGGSGGSRLLLPADRLATWAPVQKMIRSGAATDEDVAAATATAQKASFHRRNHQQGDGSVQDGDDGSGLMVDFVGFLEFIHSLDMEVDGLDVSSGNTADHDPETVKRHAHRVQMRRERAALAAEEESYGTLKEHLLAHLRSRPGKFDPETQRIAKEFHTTQAVDLEKNLVKNHLESHLRSRAGSATSAPSLAGAGGRSTGSAGGERSARIKELELAMNKRMLKHSLASGSRGLTEAGAAVGGAGTGMEAKIEIIEDRLDHRASLEQLKNQGIFQGTTPLQHSLDRHLVEQRLNKSLRNPMRPSKQDLVDHGIYIDATPRELQMEHYLAARNLKRGLEGRETIQELKDQGLYQPENSQRAAHEKLLVKALLQRKLSHAFSKEEVDRLKQKGIYKEEEHDELEAERLLVTRQLARLVSKRPDPEQLEREHPGLMEEGALAMIFEERVMPRAARASNGAPTAEGEEGVSPRPVSAEAEAESEGGPEHRVSFEALMTWPDVQEHLAGDSGDGMKLEMARHFELCDSDKDGYISFSQFLRWVELCDLDPEDHLEVTDADLHHEYLRLGGSDTTGGGVTFDQALSYPLVKRWAASASLDRDSLSLMWGGDGEGAPEEVVKKADGFKSFCRHCEARSSAAHQLRLKELQASATSQEAQAKAKLCSRMAAKLSARPDIEELKKTSVYRAGGLDPAVVHLERNLIAISLKEQLLARPAIEDLEQRGIMPQEGSKAQLDRASSKLGEALADSTMHHDDAQWRSQPSVLGAGSREEVSALLQRNLAKRLPLDRLTNKGIYVVDTDATYALLVHQVLRAHRGFKLSTAQLASGL